MSRFVRLLTVGFAVLVCLVVSGAALRRVHADKAPSMRNASVANRAAFPPAFMPDTGTGSVSLTTLGTAVTENFDTLSNTAGSTTNSALPTGWYITETGGGARDNEQYAVDTGASTTGDIYSYGAAAATDRALGALRSGTLIPLFGASFINNTGSTITSLAVAYTGEEWRLGTAGRTDQINFQFSTNATDLSTGTYSGVAALNFVTPDTATVGATNGNAAADRTALSSTITGLSIPNGATFFIRWTDTDATGADDGLAVDDFSLTPNPPPPVSQYRSVASGNWNANSTWEQSSDGGATWVPATSTPTAASDTITVRAGHIVTVSANVDADQFTINPGGTLLVNNGITFTIADGAGTDATLSGGFATAGTVTNNGQVLVNSVLQINQGGNPGSGTGTYTYDPAATLAFNNTSGSFSVNNVNFWPASNGPMVIAVTGAGGITMNVPRTINNLTTVSGVTGAANLTINGEFELDTGGFVSGSPTYGPASALTYATGGAYGRAGEWLPGVTAQPGYPNDVTITSNTTLDLPNSSPGSTFQMSGILNVQPGSTLQMAGGTPLTQALTILGDADNFGAISLSTQTGGDLKVQGSYTEAGVGTMTGNAGVLRFEGGAMQFITDFTGVTTLPKTVINKTANSVRLSNTDVSINDAAGGNSLTFSNGASRLDLNGRTLTLGGLLPAPPAGAGLIGSTTSNLILNDGGAVGDMGSIQFVSTQTLNNLTVNRTTAAGNVGLASPLSVSGALTLTAGTVTTGSNILGVGTSGTLARTSGFVIGNLQKAFGGTGSFNYAVGTTGAYSPVQVTVTAGAGNLIVKATAGQPPVVAAGSSAQRYWTLTGSGITANLVFNYLQSDVTGTEANYRIIRISGGVAASFPNNCAGGSPCVDTTANTATINGVSNFSDWTVGENIAPTAATADLSGHIAAAPGGRPFRSVAVSLQNLSTGEIKTTQSDAKGRYLFTGVDTGVEYLITPSRPGYTFNPGTLLVDFNGALSTVDFTGRPDAGSAPAKMNGAERNPGSKGKPFQR